MNKSIEVVREKSIARRITGGTFLQDHLTGISYGELVKALGSPTFGPEDSGDGKTYFEWVIKHGDEVFTLYDWKTYDVEETINKLKLWNIGGLTNASEFIKDLVSLINK